MQQTFQGWLTEQRTLQTGAQMPELGALIRFAPYNHPLGVGRPEITGVVVKQSPEYWNGPTFVVAFKLPPEFAHLSCTPGRLEGAFMMWIASRCVKGVEYWRHVGHTDDFTPMADRPISDGDDEDEDGDEQWDA